MKQKQPIWYNKITAKSLTKPCLLKSLPVALITTAISKLLWIINL